MTHREPVFDNGIYVVFTVAVRKLLPIARESTRASIRSVQALFRRLYGVVLPLDIVASLIDELTRLASEAFSPDLPVERCQVPERQLRSIAVGLEIALAGQVPGTTLFPV